MKYIYARNIHFDNPVRNGRKGSVMEDQIIELEIRNAEQTRLTDELSALVAKQQNQIDALERRLDILVTRFVVVEEQIQPETPIDKPPHY